MGRIILFISSYFQICLSKDSVSQHCIYFYYFLISEIADHAIGANTEGESRLSAEDSVASATESDSIGSIRNSSPDSQQSPPLNITKGNLENYRFFVLASVIET